MTISILLPAYKEGENLKTILPVLKEKLTALQEDFEILVVDTVSPTDDTEEICNQENVRYIKRENGNMYGDAIRTGIANACGKYIVVMDADGSHNPQDVVRFFEEMKTEQYDLIIGSRYCKGGYTDNNFILRFMSWALNVSYRVVFGLRVKDVSDSFRMYKAEQLKSLFLECNNFDIVEEILIKLNYSFPGFSIKEVPIHFSKRAAGTTKRDLVKFIVSYLKTMMNLLQIKKQYANSR